MKNYLYPKNLKSKTKILKWQARDFIVNCIFLYNMCYDSRKHIKSRAICFFVCVCHINDRDRGRSYIMQLCNDCCKALFVRATKISMEVRII